MCGKKEKVYGTLLVNAKNLREENIKRRHDNVARIVNWTVCGRYNPERRANWYEYCLQCVVESDKVKMPLRLDDTV